MPSKAKAKNAAAHQHDKRHESGLAAPGKRVVRQRSDRNLNGKAVGAVPTTTTSPSSSTNTTTNTTTTSTSSTTIPTTASSTSVDYGYDTARSGDISRQSSASTHQLAPTQCKDHVAVEDTMTRDRTNSDASNEGMAYCMSEMVEDGQQEDGYYTGSTRQTMPRSKGTMATISTILTYYPLRDAIAILILLLSLPTTLVLIIQTLFASLTFVPPTAGISLPSFKEMFNTSNLGYPALATILSVDLLFYTCWLVFSKPIQSILLDLSQAVIAVSLSGAAASTGGPTYSILTCSTIVCVVHLLRYRHSTALDYLRSVFTKLDLGIDLSIPFPTTSFLSSTSSSSSSSPASAPSSQHSWLYIALHTLLGIHIVSQGVTTCIRRSLAHANEKNTHIPVIGRGVDAEAGAGFDLVRRNSHVGPPDQNQSPTASYALDGRSRTSSPGPRDNKLRESNTKKRRKQANEVRSKQPLWAAIASTKVTFVKEMEQRDAIDDAKEAAMMSSKAKTSNNSDEENSNAATTTKSTSDRVWIDEVHDNELLLSVELSVSTLTRHDNRTDEEIRVGAGVDTSKPFYVRLNCASWSSVKISNQTGRHFTAEIFGLAPRSAYSCEIIDLTDHRTLCSINLITNPASATEQSPLTTPVQAQHQTLRPSSPHTTLKKSIEQRKARLYEVRSRSKRNKKDTRATYSDIRREINMLKAKIDNSGGVDDKQARRLQQITQHKNQADEASVQLTRQAQEMGELPEDEIANSERIRHQWQLACDMRASALHASESAKSVVERNVKDVTADLAGAESKRERLSTRRSQRKDELTAASARQQADLLARQKHVVEKNDRRETQERTETQLRFHIASMTNDAELWNNKALDAYQQGQALNNWPTPPPGYSTPATPEGPLASTNGTQMANGHHQQAPRGRSSSMLSQYSGFTDNGEEPPVFVEMRHEHAVGDDGKEHEVSSASSGTNGSSPRPDGRLFMPIKMSPIGRPRKKTDELVSPSPPPPNALGNGR